ncbi:hypothetical protein K2173_018719 [Erythroxylum novogranatense]|uniref:Cell wall protein n=1 Tax=Erythroxylum novogranatense TaxID=1862640 RepID=A0AAV8SAK0_9ROSI|nr:hypothetical protein K2173_018719 [Erythroxylum novogranatense]
MQHRRVDICLLLNHLFFSAPTMATKTLPSLLALLVLVALCGQVLAGRKIPEISGNENKKQPQWLLSDHSFLIPGIGRVLVPPSFHVPSFSPYAGGGRFVPGGDDTFVPNPGFEVPSPGHVGATPPTDP